MGTTVRIIDNVEFVETVTAVSKRNSRRGREGVQVRLQVKSGTHSFDIERDTEAEARECVVGKAKSLVADMRRIQAQRENS